MPSAMRGRGESGPRMGPTSSSASPWPKPPSDSRCAAHTSQTAPATTSGGSEKAGKIREKWAGGGSHRSRRGEGGPKSDGEGRGLVNLGLMKINLDEF